MLRIFFGIVLALFALFLLFAAYVFVVGILSLALKAAGILLIAGAILYFCFPSAFRKIVSMFRPAPPVQSPRLWDAKGQVKVFMQKPTLAQITGATNADGVITLPNETIVSVLEEDGDVVKVKLQAGDNKGKVVWAGRASVLGHTTALTKD